MTVAPGGTLAVIQARSSSGRLPGKVLAEVQGAPMIIRQIERVKRARTLDGIVVVTSTNPQDDALARLLHEEGIEFIRGDEDDVLSRFVHVIETYDPSVVVRLTGDCPLMSPKILDLVVETFRGSNADYVSNTLIPTFPDGLDVEVVSPSALRAVAEKSHDPDEREHVTLGIYRHPEIFGVRNVTDPNGRDNRSMRWTVDNAADLEFVRAVFQHLYPANPAFEYEDVLALFEKLPGLSRTDADSPRNAALDGLETGAMQHPSPGGA